MNVIIVGYMAKIQIRYENEIEGLKIIKALKGINIKKISKPLKTRKFYRFYLDIE